VKSTIEPLEGNKVKLSVQVDESEFDRDIDRAFRKLAREVNLPGFRQGKAPRRVLEARIGVGPAREQALRDAIPEYLAKAVREHEVDLIAAPEVDITDGAEAGPVVFDATCEVRPEITVPGYGGLRIELPSPTPTDDEIDEVVEGERRRHGSLEPVERPVQIGDYVTVDLVGSRNGEPVVGLAADDWEYEVGKGWVAPGFDDQLVGASVGDELTFTATPNGTDEPADFVVKVTAVSELRLPELTDEWVSEQFAEYDSVEAWRAGIAERLGVSKLAQARNLMVDRTLAALADLVDVELPESLVRNEHQGLVQGTVRRLQSQGIEIEQWLAAIGQDAETFVASMLPQAERSVRVDLALRAVATAESLAVDDDDLEREYQRIAVRVGQKPNQVRKAYERNDAVTDLIAQIRKSKALDWLMHRVEVVDPDGHPIDRDLLLGPSHDHADHDHDALEADA
jgi:trigger factor